MTTLSDYRFAPDDNSGDVNAGPQPFQRITAATGAITIAHGTVLLDRATAVAATLADPPAGANGAQLRIVALQGAAHTITAAATGFNSAGTGSQLLTLAAQEGSGVDLVAYGEAWWALNWQDIATSTTFSAV